MPRVAAVVLVAVLGMVACQPVATVTPGPAAPAVSARPAGGERLALRWAPVAGAADHELYARRVADGSVVGPVHAAGAQGEVGGLVVGERYEPGIRSRMVDGTVTEIAWGPAAVVEPVAPPEPVRDVRAAASPGSTRVTVTWTPAGTGIQPDIYAVEVRTPAGAPVGAYAVCEHPCERRTVDGLEPGDHRISVAPVSWAGGVGRWVDAAEPVAVDDGCADGGACVKVSAGSGLGPADLVAQGVNANLGGADLERLRELRVQHVRASDQTTYDAARAVGAEVTWLLSNSWYGDTGGHRAGRAALPWADWARYEEFARTYAGFLGAVAEIAWWDIQNEPYLGYFSAPGTPYGHTPDQLADHLARAEAALTEGDPGARVVGPSFDAWRGSQVRAFLDDAVERGITLDALSWHELEPGDASVNGSPTDLVEHVARLRELVAERPTLGDPEIHINEYGGPDSGRLAGWGVGFIAALEDAEVDLAMRACWGEDECAWHGSAGGLFEPGTGRALAPYWVHRFYATQTGERVATTSSNANVSAFATRDGDVVRVLLGRHGRVPATAASPFDVPLTVDGLAAGDRYRVTVERVPATTGPVAAAVPVLDGALVAGDGGTASVVLPAVADGEALLVTLTPAS